MSSETEVLAANAAFYQAFAQRDARAMDALWARGAKVACIHPGWEALSGREAVMASWRAILRNPQGPPIQYARAAAHILGETAFVICTELLPGARLVATNVFVREDGAWKLVHHQSGPAAQKFEVEEPPDLPN